MSSRLAVAAVIGLALAATACQTVIESGDETALEPLCTPLPALTSTTSTTTTIAPTTTAPPLTTTTTIAPATTPTPSTSPPTTLPPTTTSTTATTTTTTLPATTTTTTSTTSTTTTSTTLPASTTTTAEPFYSDEPSSGTLSEGDQGDRTKAMQAKLVALDYLNFGADDGLFGKVTTAAVKQFQEDNDLVVDGLVGPNTSTALDAAVDGL